MESAIMNVAGGRVGRAGARQREPHRLSDNVGSMWGLLCCRRSSWRFCSRQTCLWRACLWTERVFLSAKAPWLDVCHPCCPSGLRFSSGYALRAFQGLFKLVACVTRPRPEGRSGATCLLAALRLGGPSRLSAFVHGTGHVYSCMLLWRASNTGKIYEGARHW